MPHARLFRFGVKFRRAQTFEQLGERARRIEAMGYSTLLLSDHFWNVLAPLPTATAVAAATTTLRVGTNVLGNDFRHPVVLAKEVATVDLLSGGRFELGYGAGWMKGDYRQAGIEMDSPGVRIERMAEAVGIMKGLWSEGEVHHRGEHYAVDGLDGFPKPAQPGGPPILIGGGGRRILGIAAQTADIVGINPIAASGIHDTATNHDASPEAVDRKLDWLRGAGGDRLAEVELSMNAYIARVTDESDAAERVMSERFEMPPEQAIRVPYGWVGPIEKIIDDLLGWRERWGISYWVVQEEVAGDLAPLVAKLAGS
ncbi:MAG: luciferase [Deltaproteobacteria bacterium]|nr:luciferase [Deltaproteobacteria bacterium]